MIVTEEPTYAPLDEAAMKKALLLVKSYYCARPVFYEGKEHHLQYIGIGPKGGGIELQAYLSGLAVAIDSSKIEIKD